MRSSAFHHLYVIIHESRSGVVQTSHYVTPPKLWFVDDLCDCLVLPFVLNRCWSAFRRPSFQVCFAILHSMTMLWLAELCPTVVSMLSKAHWTRPKACEETTNLALSLKIALGGPRERKLVPGGDPSGNCFPLTGDPPGNRFPLTGIPPQGKFQWRLSCAVFLVCSGDGFVMTSLASTCLFECMGPNADDGFICCICTVLSVHLRRPLQTHEICQPHSTHHSGCDMMVGFTISLAFLVLARCSGMLPTWI